MQQAVGLASTRLASGGADLVILNKFGLSEAEGRGFRSLIGEAISLGIPVLTGLSDTHRAAFHQFAEGLADVLQPEVEAIIGWYRRTSTGATSTQEGATVA